ncbi:MAG: ABC transporter permease [Candidatus Brocadiia bacterium]
MDDQERASWRRGLWAWASSYVALAGVLAAMVVVFSVFVEGFFDARTFRAIASQVPVAVILASGMTLVLIVGGIDLSVGSVLGLSGVVMGLALVDGEVPLALAVLACLGVGLVCGALNGLTTVAWGLPSFIVTLGMLQVARGTAQLVSGSHSYYLGARVKALAAASVLGLPLPFVAALVVVVGGQLLLSRTVFGRYVVAVGTNEEAVRLSGIDPRPIRLAVFTLCGFLVSVAAVFHTSRFETADPKTGAGFELAAIAAAVIGGTSLMGGRGSVVASFFGVLIIRVLGVGLSQLGAGHATKTIITGCVIVVAAVADHYRRRLAQRRRGA